MKLPTLRQVDGCVMIVNTLLPAIVVLAVGILAWSATPRICAAITGGEEKCDVSAAVSSLYVDSKTYIDTQFSGMGAKFGELERGAKKTIESLPSLELAEPKIPRRLGAKRAAAQAKKAVIAPFNDYIASPLKTKTIDSVTSATNYVVDPYVINIYRKLNALDETRENVWAEARNLGSSLYWLFLIIAIWLVFSYVLWACRRLSTGWQCLQNQA